MWVRLKFWDPNLIEVIMRNFAYELFSCLLLIVVTSVKQVTN